MIHHSMHSNSIKANSIKSGGIKVSPAHAGLAGSVLRETDLKSFRPSGAFSSDVYNSEVYFSGKKSSKKPPSGAYSRRSFLQQAGFAVLAGSFLPASLINRGMAQDAPAVLQNSSGVLPVALYDVASANRVQNYLAETLRLAQTDTPPRQAVHWDRLRPNLFVMAKYSHPGLLPVAVSMLTKALQSEGAPNPILDNTSQSEALQDLCSALGLFGPSVFQQQPETVQAAILKGLLDLTQPASKITSEPPSQSIPVIQGSLTPLQQAACYAWTQLAPEPLLHEYLKTYSGNLPSETRLNRLKHLKAQRLPDFFIDTLSKKVQTYLEKSPSQPEERAVWGETLKLLSLWINQSRTSQPDLSASKNNWQAVNDTLLKGIKGFFLLKDPMTKVTYPNPGDYPALEALAGVALNQPECLQQLTQLWLTHPEVMLNACQANIKGDFTPAHQAGEALRQVHSAHGAERLHETFVSWLKDPEKLKTPDNLSKLLQVPLNVAQLARVQGAALAMLASRPDETLRPLLLDLLQKGDEWMTQVAILGLETLHNVEDLPALANVAHNSHYPEKTRVLAGQAALKLLYPKELPPELSKKIASDFPLNGLMDRFFEFGPEGTVTRQVDTGTMSDWIESLGESRHVDSPDKLQKTGIPATLLESKLLQASLDQIQNTPQSPARLVANLQLLRLAGYEPAYAAMTKILNHTAKSVSPQSLPSEYEARAEALHQIKRTTLQSLGSVIPLSNLQDIRQLGLYFNLRPEEKPAHEKPGPEMPGIDTSSMLPPALPIVSKFVGYQRALLMSLSDIGKRFQAKQQASGLDHEEEVVLSFLRNQVREQFFRASRPLLSEAQTRHNQNQLRVALATTLIDLGGEDVVLQMARSLQRNIDQLRAKVSGASEAEKPDLLWHQDVIATLNDARRDALYALIAEGKQLQSPEVQTLLNLPSWNLKKMHEYGTGKGESVVLIDGNVGYEMAVPEHLKQLMPDLKDKITYSKSMLMRPQYFEQGYHWLRVLSILLTVAPNLEHINSRTWDGLLKAPPPFSTQAMTYPPVMAMMDLMESKLLPPSHPDYEPARLVSNSWGNSTNRIYDEALRMQYNVLSGLYESFERLGGLTVYSGGNGGYDRPLSEFAVERGNSPIGDGFTAEGECLPTQGVFYALPDDPVNESLTTRASVPVSAEDARSRPFFKIPGVHPVLSYDEATHQPFGHWGMASSYAAPALTGLMAVLNEQTKRRESLESTGKAASEAHPVPPQGKNRENLLRSVSTSGEFQTFTPEPSRLFRFQNLKSSESRLIP
jgi:hypothetical protein